MTPKEMATDVLIQTLLLAHIEAWNDEITHTRLMTTLDSLIKGVKS